MKNIKVQQIRRDTMKPPNLSQEKLIEFLECLPNIDVLPVWAQCRGHLAHVLLMKMQLG